MDLIDRQTAIDAMRKYEVDIPQYAPREVDIFWDDAIDACCDAVEALPSAEPVRKGKWIWDDEGYHCSECFFHAHGNTLECLDGTYRFCPNCGADMRGEEDESN